MNIEEIRAYCLAKCGAEECFPFDDTTLVFKVGGRMFALLALDKMRLNLKCDPDIAIELRGRFPAAVSAGWHMNKKTWNTIALNECLPPALLCEWIDNSYDLAVQKLTKKQQQQL